MIYLIKEEGLYQSKDNFTLVPSVTVAVKWTFGHVVDYGMNAQVQPHCSRCITPSNAIRALSVQHSLTH